MNNRVKIYIDHINVFVFTIISEMFDKYEIISSSYLHDNSIELIKKSKPKIVIIDPSLVDDERIDEYIQYVRSNPEIKIIVILKYYKKDMVEELLQKGIEGYVLRDDIEDDLLVTIEKVLKGNIYMSSKISSSFAKDYLTVKTDNI